MAGEKKRLLENFISLGALQIVSYVIPLISLPYLSRVLGVEKFGLVFFAFAFMQYFIMLTDYGFGLSAIKASCIIVANAGNMYKNLFSISKDSRLDDGMFDIFILKTQNLILFFIEFLKIMFNLKINNSLAEYHKAKDLKIKNRYCLAHSDGEKMKFSENLDFQIQNNAINIYCSL